MRVLVASDLHFEFHEDGGRSFVESLDPRGIDAIIVAGDLSDSRGLPDALALLCARFAHVVYVHGNHEFYRASRPSVLAATSRAVAALPNLHWLDHSSVEIGGHRFVGTPLWYPNDPAAPRHMMNDFHAIEDFAQWFERENERAVGFLATSVREGDIVITHMLPSQRSVSPRFTSSPLNPFFVCDVEEALLRHRPALWIHGHTHDSCDYVLGTTRVVCNPFGYAGVEENRRFDAHLVLEL